MKTYRVVGLWGCSTVELRNHGVLEFWSLCSATSPLKLIGETNRVQQPTVGLTVEKLLTNSHARWTNFVLKSSENSPKKGSKSTWEGPWRLPNGAPENQNRPRASQERPKSAQERPKRAQERPKCILRATKSVPRTSQERPRASRERPKSAQKGLDSVPGGLARHSWDLLGTTLEAFLRQPTPEHCFDQ